MAELINPNPERSRLERIKYISGFYSTMRKIWEEQIVLLGIIDTKQLLWSVNSNVGHARMDNDGRVVDMEWEFLEYGLWVNYGTGKEVPRGNPGDIGRDKIRQKKIWFSTKFFASYMNMQEFMADNLGREFLGMMSNAMSYDRMRYGSQFYRDNPMPTDHALRTNYGGYGQSSGGLQLF